MSKSTSDSGDISKPAHKADELLTKSNSGDLMSVRYEISRLPLFHGVVSFKLKKAELEALSTNERYTHEEVFSELKRTVMDVAGHENV